MECSRFCLKEMRKVMISLLNRIANGICCFQAEAGDAAVTKEREMERAKAVPLIASEKLNFIDFKASVGFRVSARIQ